MPKLKNQHINHTIKETKIWAVYVFGIGIGFSIGLLFYAGYAAWF
jgi:hypothetical protein